MTNSIDLENACNEYFSLIETLTELSLKRDEEDAKRLVALRSELSKKMQNIEMAVRKITGENLIDEKTKDLFEEFRETFSNERKAVAKHQTKWAAPLMRDDRTGYESDASRMFAMHKKNHDWRVNGFLNDIKKYIK